MKSREVTVLFNVLTGLFKDASLAYPELSGGFLKDKERVALMLQTRGLAFFTLDLPCLDRLLLDGLEHGRLMLEGPISHRVSKRIKVPRLFQGLWLRVFDKSSSLKLDVDVTAIAFLRQITCLGKKLLVECSSKRVKQALEAYHEVDRTLRSPTLSWALDSLDVGRRNNLHFADCLPAHQRLHDLFSLNEGEEGRCRAGDQRLLDQCQRVADLVASQFLFCDPTTFAGGRNAMGKGLGFRHGNGAVAERLKQDKKSEFKYWPLKLQGWFPFQVLTGMDSELQNHEAPSRMACVPKTAKGPRIIAAEPVAHQWCQQSLLSWMNESIRNSFIGNFVDFTRQGKSGDLVLKASRSRSLATVDLSDASDRLSCWTIERMFRTSGSMLSALHAARTRWIRIDIPGSDSSFIKLKKFASQGTAVTFPVQSVVFLTIALAACLSEDDVSIKSALKYVNRIRVYGDDIIIPVHGYARLCRIMDLLQLKVNVAKSYVTGHFRESCGTDGYQGSDVTPIKPKVIVADGPASCQAVIDTTNNLFIKGYWHASDSLKSTIPLRIQRRLRIVGRNDAGLPGFASYSGSDELHLDKRWNSRFHRYEGRVWTVRPRSTRRNRGELHTLLDFFASSHNPWNPRIVSEYEWSRKVRSDFLWEPLNHGARGTSIDEVQKSCEERQTSSQAVRRRKR